MSSVADLAAEIVAQLYEGVLAPEAWNSGLADICRLAGSSHAALTTWDRHTNAGAVTESIGLTDACRQQFSDHFCALDPARDHIDRIALGNWYIDHVNVGLAVMRRSAFYQDFLYRFGFGSVVAAPLVRDQTRDSFLVLQYPVGKLMHHMPAELAGLLPHISRALSLQRRFQAVATQAALIDSVFARLNVPVFVLDAGAYIVLANVQAERALTRHRCLHTAAGRLVLQGAPCQRFRALLAGACTTRGPRVASAMHLRCSQEEPALQILITPLPMWHAECRNAATPRALMLLHDPQCFTYSHGALLQQLYGLTPAEIRVALGLLRGASPRECAAASGISLATVRTQLSAVLQKTNTTRQSELIHLLGTMALMGASNNPVDCGGSAA